MRRRRFLELGATTAVAAAAALLPGPAALACPVFPADGELDFLVLRHDVAIGSHRIRFARAAGRAGSEAVLRSCGCPKSQPPGPVRTR